MRRWIGILALVLSLLFLALVPKLREWQRNQAREEMVQWEHKAALYYVHVQAVDGLTGEPVGFQVEWDHEEISPFSKGAGPSVIETLEDGSKVLSLVGVVRDEPYVVTLKASGYRSHALPIEGQSGGILERGVKHTVTLIELEQAQ